MMFRKPAIHKRAGDVGKGTPREKERALGNSTCDRQNRLSREDGTETHGTLPQNRTKRQMENKKVRYTKEFSLGETTEIEKRA